MKQLSATVLAAGTLLAAFSGSLHAQAPAKPKPATAQPASRAPNEPPGVVRFACEGASAGAEIFINGQFKGECPVDVTVQGGTLAIRAVKKVDAARERVHEQEFRMAGGTAKRVEVELGPPRLNKEAQRAEDARLAAERKAADDARAAAQARADAEKREADEKQRVRQQAANELRQRADAGDVPSMVKLADAYRTGEGVGASAEQALVWDLKAAQRGDGASMVRVGEAYELGKGVARHYAEAKSWYQKAAEAGVAAGMGGFAAMNYNDNTGLPRDVALALSWAQRGAAAGDGRSVSLQGVVRLAGAPQDPQAQREAMALFRDASAKGERRAMLLVGFCYIQRFQCGVEKDWTEALKWFRAAYDKGDERAISWIGHAYREGVGGVRKDEAAALQWIRRGVDVYDAESLRDLAAIHWAGGLGLPKDPASAVRLWRVLIERENNANAMNDLGLAYWEGNGVPKDNLQAQLWWRKAAALGEPQAKRSLKITNLE